MSKGVYELGHRGDCLRGIGKGKCTCELRQCEADLATARAEVERLVKEGNARLDNSRQGELAMSQRWQRAEADNARLREGLRDARKMFVRIHKDLPVKQSGPVRFASDLAGDSIAAIDTLLAETEGDDR